jgi:uncharacterized membrane protein YgcG
MSPESVPPREMGIHDHDDELDRIFEGLRTAFPARPVANEDEHVAGMISTAHLLADKGEPVVRPASNADAPAAQVSWLPKQRRNRMSDKKLDRNWTHGVALKVLAPATVFFTMLGGVAWAGGLPQPLQRTASHVAGLAGVTIDDGTDATDGETPDTSETDAPGTTTFDQGGDATDATSTDNQDGNAQGEDNSGDTSTDNNQDGDSQGEDNSGDTTDGQDGDSQGDTSGDATSGDNNQGDSTEDQNSGDGSSQDSSGDSSGSGDTSGDSSGSGSGSSGGDGQD